MLKKHDHNPVNSILVLIIFNGHLRAELFWGHLMRNCFRGSNYISNDIQIRNNEKSPQFKEEQEDAVTLREL